jgi:hypothetical protein
VGCENPAGRDRVGSAKKNLAPESNPTPGISQARIDRAANLLEDFSGHEARTVDIVKMPSYDTALRVGRITHIGYEAVRDGEKKRYEHDFKAAAAPDLCVTHDGQQILLIGGSYLFKDTGINDVL